MNEICLHIAYSMGDCIYANITWDRLGLSIQPSFAKGQGGTQSPFQYFVLDFII